MPRRTASFPKYRKHRASGQAIVELSGKRFYLGPHGTKTSEREYDRLIGEWLARGRQPEPEEPDDPAAKLITVVELIAKYLEHANTYYRKNGEPTTEVRDLKLSLRPLKELYGRFECIEFGPIALKSVRQKMVADGLSRGVVNQRIQRIVRMFKWGVSEQLFPPGVHQALKSVEGLKQGRSEAVDHPPIPPVSDTIVDATLPHMPPVVADMVAVQRLTGMRPSEVCSLRPMDLERDGEIWHYVPANHKTQHHGKRRIIPVGPMAQRILLSYLARDAAMNCFRPVDTVAKQLAERRAARRTPLKWGNRPGTNRRTSPMRTAGDSYSVGTYRNAIYRACDRAFPHPTLAAIKSTHLTAEQQQELKAWQDEHRWAPNRLRHTAATAIRKRFGIEASSTVLGHSGLSVTEIYAERDLQLAARVAAAMG